jgi:hypothetical protein
MFSSKSTSSADRLALLNCRRLPARLNTSEAAVLLGFQEHDISVLTATGLLEPLGKPAANAPKYFAAVEVEALAANIDWLAKATRLIAKRWREKNTRRSSAHCAAAA